MEDKTIIKKHAGGRPTKYNDTTLLVTKAYFEEAVNNKDIPTIERLSILLDVDDDTLVEWGKRYKEFSALIKKIKSLQRDWLVRRSLGRFNPAGAIFLLKALHGYIDTSRTEITGRNGGEVTLRIVPMLTKYQPLKLAKSTETIGLSEAKA